MQIRASLPEALNLVIPQLSILKALFLSMNTLMKVILIRPVNRLWSIKSAITNLNTKAQIQGLNL